MKYELEQELPIPTLNGQKIILRPCKLGDFEAIRKHRQDPENRRYIGPPEDDSTTREIVELLCEPWKLVSGRWNGFVICLPKNTDKAIGEIVFKIDDWENQRFEIGFQIHHSAAGKGICTEAAQLLINHLFSDFGVFKVVAKCDPRNIASYKVMEKLGMKKEAVFKQHYRIGDEWTDQLDYGLLASEWVDSTHPNII